ncbi:DUF1707 domain-containing protein [Nocardiopsis gilva]|nr:DUF1707 domain-containing protein [Nocardiopsis gilva]
MESLPGSPSPRQRVSDAEREQVVRHISQAYADGRLTLDEFNDRSTAAYQSTFDDELRALLHDLPGALDVVPARPETVELRQRSGVIRRKGDWVVPRRLKVSSEAGSVRLDLTEATIPHPVVDIEVSMRSGSVLITLPRGASADLDGLTSDYGAVRSRVPERAEPGALHVRISGHITYGSVKVRHGRR